MKSPSTKHHPHPTQTTNHMKNLFFAPKWHTVTEKRTIMGDYDTQNSRGKVFVYIITHDNMSRGV